MIDLVFTGQHVRHYSLRSILLVVIAIVGFSLRLSVRIASIVFNVQELINELFIKIQELSSSDISALGTDTLVTCLINDVNQSRQPLLWVFVS